MNKNNNKETEQSTLHSVIERFYDGQKVQCNGDICYVLEDNGGMVHITDNEDLSFSENNGWVFRSELNEL